MEEGRNIFAAALVSCHDFPAGDMSLRFGIIEALGERDHMGSVAADDANAEVCRKYCGATNQAGQQEQAM